FGSVRLGTASAPISFTVTNVGDAPFTVNAIVLSDATDFSLSLTSPDASGYPVLLPMNGKVTFAVAARPGSLGFLTGTVQIMTDIPGTPTTTLPLAVVGVAAGLAVAQQRIDFGGVDIRGPAAERSLTLSNFGTTTLTVRQPTVTGPGASAYTIFGIGADGLMLDPGLSASIAVAYAPTVESSAEPDAAISITSDAPDAPSIVVPLSGHGTDRHLSLSSTTLSFPRTAV